ncbi:MAG: ATP-binding protein, partial [Bdellovibrionota bacterium]
EILIPNADKVRVGHRARPVTLEMMTTPGMYEDVGILRKDGYVRFVDIHIRLVQSGGKQLAIALFRDLTEKKRMERELITKHSELKNAYFQLEKKNIELQSMQDTLVQSGKMAALGELTAGIAHELNQPLQGIRGYAQELLTITSPGEKTNDPAEVSSDLREIMSSVDKMVAIISQLRTFTRRSTENHEFTDVHTAIEESLKMLSRQFASRGISVNKQFNKDIPKIYANPLQLEQVFINLATNARDAIDETKRGKGTIWIHTRATENFVEISYKDDGCGMNDRTQAKAFNPFFTTKEVGQGMGLGLSLSYGILTKIHGTIVVESEMGKGTEFVIRIPKDFREMG